VYSFVHQKIVSFLPLQGFWNCCVYITISSSESSGQPLADPASFFLLLTSQCRSYTAKVAIQVCDTNTGLILKFCTKVVDDNGGDYCLARSWNPWTEKSLIVLVDPLLEFVRLQLPFSCSILSSPNKVTLLSRIGNWRKPVCDDSALLIILVRDQMPHAILHC
jgi:hypothetical protein